MFDLHPPAYIRISSLRASLVCTLLNQFHLNINLGEVYWEIICSRRAEKIKRSLSIFQSQIIITVILPSISAVLTRDQALLSSIPMSNLWSRFYYHIHLQVRKQVQSISVTYPRSHQWWAIELGLILETTFSPLCYCRNSFKSSAWWDGVPCSLPLARQHSTLVTSIVIFWLVFIFIDVNVMLREASLEDERNSGGLDGFGKPLSTLVTSFRLMMSVGDFCSDAQRWGGCKVEP